MVEASFTLVSCDGCRVRLGLSTDPHWNFFETTWFAGILCQFCPDCKDKPEHEAAQIAEADWLEAIKNLDELPGAMQI